MGDGTERELPVPEVLELPFADEAEVVGVALVTAEDELLHERRHGGGIAGRELAEVREELGEVLALAARMVDERVPDGARQAERISAHVERRVVCEAVREGCGEVEDGGGNLLYAADLATVACGGQAALAISWGSGTLSPRSAAWTARRRYALGSTRANLALSMRL